MWPQLAVCALNLHFCGCAKTVEAGSIIGIFFVSVACNFGIFGFLHSAFVNFSVDMWHACLSYFLDTVLRPSAPSLLLCWVSKHFWQGVSVSVLSFLFTFLFFCVRFRKVSNVLCGSRICCYFWSRWWSFGRIIKITESSPLLLEAAACIGGAALFET
jgi:hypothetical protein